jgi:uncharacterized membrane protein HdeD (DUF308 family)
MAKEEMKWHKCKGWIMVVLGLLILANAYWAVLGWDYFIGIILVLVGIIKLLKK